MAHADLDRRTILLAGLAAAAARPTRLAQAEDAPPSATVLDTYLSFAAAQNARDLVTVRSLFTDEPPFLWVSDGLSIWGRDAAVARMATFMEADVWTVIPSIESARIVVVDPLVSYLHLSLTLVIGPADPRPDSLDFLVSVLGVRERMDAPVRIAALFTTTAKARG